MWTVPVLVDRKSVGLTKKRENSMQSTRRRLTDEHESNAGEY